MNTVRSMRYAPGAARAQALPDGMETISDAQALKELIEILRKPFQSHCDLCRGSGLSGSGRACRACRGTGRILIDLL